MMETVTDKAGRCLTLRDVGVLETLRLYKALGPELSQNDAYLGLAVLAARVAMIDQIPVPFPASETAVEGVLARLGNDGAAAVARAVAPAPAAEVIVEAGN